LEQGENVKKKLKKKSGKEVGHCTRKQRKSTAGLGKLGGRRRKKNLERLNKGKKHRAQREGPRSKRRKNSR